MTARSLPARPLALLSLLLAGAASGCAAVPGPASYGPPPRPSSAFNERDFAWSTGQGSGGVDGRIAYRREGQAYACTGSIVLTPDTPYTRARFRTLYGSTDQAALPEAVVRARTVPDPAGDYRSYVRSATCSDGRFSVSGLPSGGWFIIVPVSAGGDRVVLMRHVDIRGRRISITL
jgi:hypothetical protein